ncbi:hypothetical protein [Gorillibacterium massiliense]|uniref:hypothetical protein n=1 Tax=Gorillibacterium massiliense TaxID=1280390 RepID=UPI0004B48BEB|nr:hypothetical protein [Gorillibacterium massiliense]
MWKILGVYAGIQIFAVIVIIIAILSTVVIRRNRLNNATHQPPPGFQRTDEIFIDPTTGIRQQVWFNPYSGERFYQSTDTKR